MTNRVQMAGSDTLILSDQDHVYLRGVSWHLGKGGRAKAYIGGQYVYCHRLVAELKLGRSLEDNEVVGFKNGNPLDCRRENLVIGDRSEVMRFIWKQGDIRKLEKDGDQG